MATFPKDQFDEYPDDLARRGAHRSPRKKGRPWLSFLVALVTSAALVVGGLYLVSTLNDQVEFGIPGVNNEPVAQPTPEPTPTVLPLLDATTLDKARKITITVLNGTEVAGLQDTAGDALAELKWPIQSRVVASSTDIQKTAVYYGDPSDEDVALGLANAMGLGVVRQSDNFPGAKITIVLGADYAAAQG